MELYVAGSRRLVYGPASLFIKSRGLHAHFLRLLIGLPDWMGRAVPANCHAFQVVGGRASRIK